MDRRALLVSGVVLLAAPLGARAQQAGMVYRIGVLATTTPEAAAPLLAAFRQRLQGLGWVEGRNLEIDGRFVASQQALADHAIALVKSKVDVIVTVATPATIAAKRTTETIPIVMLSAFDPIHSGLVATLTRPGGNVTGNATLSPELTAKQAQILKEAVPGLSRVGLLWNPSNPAYEGMVEEFDTATQSLGIRTVSIEISSAVAIESRLNSAVVTAPIDALLVMPDSVIHLRLPLITAFAIRHRLPSASLFREFIQAGGLFSYGPSLSDLVPRLAVYVDKILRGARPADLPVEQPTKFDLGINLNTAKALGLTIPRSLLLRANQVIE